jgi:hypothetical protein
MSLRPQPLPPVPEATVAAVQAAWTPGMPMTTPHERLLERGQ